MRFIHNDPIMKECRQNLRNNATYEEVVLWNNIKKLQLGVKFRRQFGIGPYVADFFCHELKLVIEIDGGYHESENQKEYDAERDRFFQEIGCLVLRFSNNQICDTLEIVLYIICQTITKLSTKTPPLLGEVPRLCEAEGYGKNGGVE